VFGIKNPFRKNSASEPPQILRRGLEITRCSHWNHELLRGHWRSDWPKGPGGISVST
jgi:hypothetical protein